MDIVEARVGNQFIYKEMDLVSAYPSLTLRLYEMLRTKMETI